jgi:branched-chain amino acid transport system substrate-binding protein
MAQELQDVSGPPGDPFSFQELDQAIQALQDGDDIDYQGASGAIDIDENGDATAGVYDVYEYKGGALDIIDEVPVATPTE